MIRECQKLISQKIIWILGVVLILVNAILFYSECVPLMEIKDLYNVSYSTLQEETTNLQSEVDNAFMYGSEDEIEEALDKEETLATYNEALARMEYQSGYHSWLISYIGEMKTKASSGLFGQESQLEMTRGVSIYSQLSMVRPTLDFQGTSEVILNWNLPFYLALLMAFFTALFFCFQERRDGTMVLIKPMAGYGRLFIDKTLSVIITSLTTLIIILVTEVIISSLLLGVPDISAPIQGVYGYRTVPYNLSVLTYGLLCLGWQMLLIITISFLVILIMNAMDSIVRLVATIGIIIVITILLATSTNLWLDTASMITLANAPLFFSHSFVLFVGTFLLPQEIIALVYVILLAVIACLLAYKVYLKKSPFVSTKTIKASIHMPMPRRISSFEAYKQLISSGGLIVILLISGIEVYRIMNYQHYLTAEEYAYRNYSEVLEGPKTSEKEEYLSEESLRIEEAMAAGEDEMVNMTALNRASSKYYALADNETYVYESGYVAYFKAPGKNYYGLSIVLGILGSIIVFARNATIEYETSVMSLLQAYGQKEKVLAIKRRRSLMYTILISLITYIPWLIYIANKYDFDSFMASASLIGISPIIPSFIPIIALFIIQFILYVMIYFSVSLVSERLAQKTNNMVSVLALTSAIYLLVIIYLLI